MRTCVICGKEFFSRDARRKTCGSAACKRALHKDNMASWNARHYGGDRRGWKVRRTFDSAEELHQAFASADYEAVRRYFALPLEERWGAFQLLTRAQKRLARRWYEAKHGLFPMHGTFC